MPVFLDVIVLLVPFDVSIVLAISCCGRSIMYCIVLAITCFGRSSMYCTSSQELFVTTRSIAIVCSTSVCSFAADLVLL
jgi:hypothetical protein